MRRGPASPLPSVRCCVPALGSGLAALVVRVTRLPADLDGGERVATIGKDGTAVRYVVILAIILAVLYLYGLALGGS